MLAKTVSRTPSLFDNCLDKDNENCMFTEAILNSWDLIHIRREVELREGLYEVAGRELLRTCP